MCIRDRSRSLPETSDFVAHLRQVLHAASPFPLLHHGKPSVHLPPALLSCSDVFVRVDAVKRPLTPPYCGPYRVLERGPKVFVLDRSGKPWSVSVDRLKPLLPPELPFSASSTSPPPGPDASVPAVFPSATASAAASPTATSPAFPSLPAPTSSDHPLTPTFLTRSGRLVKRPNFLNV